MKNLHAEIETLAGDLPAAYIDVKPLSRITIDKLVETIVRLKGISIPSGNLSLNAVLLDASWSSEPAGKFVEDVNNPLGDKVSLTVTSNLKILVGIHLSNDPISEISQVTVEVDDIRLNVSAEENSLIVSGCDYKWSSGAQRSAQSEKIIQESGIDSLEVAHLEGHIRYGVVTQAITTSLSQEQSISLSDMFPFLNLGSNISLKIIGNGTSLALLPDSKNVLRNDAACHCSSGPDFSVSDSVIEIVEPADPRPNDEIGSVSLGGSIAENKDPFRDFGRRGFGEGETGVYLPLKFASELMPEFEPGLVIKAEDKGTIGYNARASIGFQDIKLSIDKAGGGLLLDINLDISVSAYCDFEIFKGVRVPIGWAVIMPTQGSKASLQIGFYPSIDASGSVKLKSTLIKCDMGSYVAVVVGIGTALKIIGVTAWIGFLVDVVLATILSVGLPHALKKELSNKLGSKEWKLLDAWKLAMGQRSKLWPLSLTNVTDESMLISFRSEG